MQIKNHLVVGECVMVFFKQIQFKMISGEESLITYDGQKSKCLIRGKQMEKARTKTERRKKKYKGDAWTEQRYWAGFWPRAVTLWWRETRAPQEYVDDARKRAPKAFSLLSAYCARVPRSSTRGSAAATGRGYGNRDRFPRAQKQIPIIYYGEIADFRVSQKKLA